MNSLFECEIPRDELKKEAKRIYNVLFKLYKNKTVVNMSFIDLVCMNVAKEYKTKQYTIAYYLVKLIPINLSICPNNQYVFVTNREFNILTNKLGYL